MVTSAFATVWIDAEQGFVARRFVGFNRTWDDDPFVLTNFYGKRILLSPGQTWFHLVPKDWQIPSS